MIVGINLEYINCLDSALHLQPFSSSHHHPHHTDSDREPCPWIRWVSTVGSVRNGGRGHTAPDSGRERRGWMAARH